MISLYFVFVDDHAEFGQKAVGKAASTQRGEQLPDRLMSPLPHAPAPRQHGGDCGLMIHPTEESHGENK